MVSDKTETPKQRWQRENAEQAFEGGRRLLKQYLSPAQMIERMAKTIVDRTAANDNCTAADLIAAGFSEAEIARYGNRAVARAVRMAPGLRGAA